MNEQINTFRQRLPNITDHDINALIDSFFIAFPDKISHYCQKTYTEVTPVSLAAFKALLQEELSNAVISFVNNNYNFENLKAYLLGTVRAASKRLLKSDKKTKSSYVCPGCRFYEMTTILENRKKILYCNICNNNLITESSPEKINLSKIFAEHSTQGHGCPDCSRFIPKSLVFDKNYTVSCPYPDCFFSGNVNDLISMSHPRCMASIELSIDTGFLHTIGVGRCSAIDRLQDPGRLSGRTSVDRNSTTDARLVVNSDYHNYLSVLLSVIDNQQKSLRFNRECTLLHKSLMYDAYRKMINLYPEIMVSYLVHLNRQGLQHKIFQEYVRLLEQNLPYSYIRNNEKIVITSLLDKSLCVFDGVSEFSATVDETSEIKNGTKEMYVGGRTGFYYKPYFIGKILDIKDQHDCSILDQLQEYSFSKIKLKPEVRGTVSVKHLRISPHYQMGGLVYLNRIRRKIVDSVYYKLNGKKRPVSR